MAQLNIYLGFKDKILSLENIDYYFAVFNYLWDLKNSRKCASL